MPEIRYARSEGLNIAYQVFGEGPVDVLLVPGFISHIEYSWQEPLLARFLRRLSMYARVIAFDKRGMGLSDRDPRQETPSLVQRIRDIEAVMEAAGSTTAALLAWSEGGATAIAFAHAHPGKTSALLLLETTPRFSSSDDFPAGVPREMLELFIDISPRIGGPGLVLSCTRRALPTTPALARGGRPTNAWPQPPGRSRPRSGCTSTSMFDRCSPS
ncbi:MAG: alpha/beta hydrolase [Terracoccus sp.]